MGAAVRVYLGRGGKLARVGCSDTSYTRLENLVQGQTDLQIWGQEGCPPTSLGHIGMD